MYICLSGTFCDSAGNETYVVFTFVGAGGRFRSCPIPCTLPPPGVDSLFLRYVFFYYCCLPPAGVVSARWCLSSFC